MHITNSMAGGVGSIITDLVYTSSNSCNATILSLDNKSKCNHQKIDQLQDLYFCRVNFPRTLGYSSEMRKMIRQKNNVDIIHQHGSWLFSSGAGNNWALKNKIPIIYSVHGALLNEALQKSKIKKKVVSKLFQKKMYQNAACLVANTREEAKSLRSFNLTNPIAIIPNGIDENEFIELDKNRKSALRDKYNIPKNKKVGLCISRIHPAKGIEDLINANKSDDFYFLIAGHGQDSYISHLKNMIKNKKNFKILPAVYGEDKNELYTLSDFFILPTHHESFGISILEAMAKKMVVLTTHGAPWEKLSQENCGIWVPSGKDGISKGLIEIEKKWDELALMGEKSYNLARQYHISKCSNMMMELYNWVLNKCDKPSFVETM